MDMSDRCWICDRTDELGVREIVTFRDSDRGPEVTRVATCFDCRAEMIQLHDARERALSRVPEKRIRFKAFDIAGMMLVLASGMFIAAWAAWVGWWFYLVGLGFLIGSPIAGFVMWSRGRSIEAKRTDAWSASAEHARFKSLEEKLASRWDVLRRELEAHGRLTEVEDAERTLRTLEPEELVEPSLWKPHEPPSYVEREGDRSQRRPLAT
jgi:hypothetical protein